MVEGIKSSCIFCNGLGYHYHLPIGRGVMSHPEPVPKLPCVHCGGKGYNIAFPEVKPKRNKP